METSNLKVNIDIINEFHKPSILFSRTPQKHFDWDYTNSNKIMNHINHNNINHINYNNNNHNNHKNYKYKREYKD